MSSVEDLITQVSSSEDDVHLSQPVAHDHKADQQPPPPPPKKSCCWRWFCCCCTCCLPKAPPPQQPPQLQNQAQPQKAAPPADTKTKPAQPVPATPPHPLTKYLLAPLPPEQKGKKTLVLDLDETLVHSSFKPIPNPDFVISIELENVIHKVYVRKRPGVDNFLRVVGEKFEVVVFTASLAKYADPLLDILDKGKIVKTRLFREACVQHYGNYVKDLTHLGRTLEHTIIIDNSPFSYMFQPDNAIPISSWFNDRNDRQLYDLIPFLESLIHADDVVGVLQKHKLTFNSNPG